MLKLSPSSCGSCPMSPRHRHWAFRSVSGDLVFGLISIGPNEFDVRVFTQCSRLLHYWSKKIYPASSELFSRGAHELGSRAPAVYMIFVSPCPKGASSRQVIRGSSPSLAVVWTQFIFSLLTTFTQARGSLAHHELRSPRTWRTPHVRLPLRGECWSRFWFRRW